LGFHIARIGPSRNIKKRSKATSIIPLNLSGDNNAVCQPDTPLTKKRGDMSLPPSLNTLSLKTPDFSKSGRVSFFPFKLNFLPTHRPRGGGIPPVTYSRVKIFSVKKRPGPFQPSLSQWETLHEWIYCVSGSWGLCTKT